MKNPYAIAAARRAFNAAVKAYHAVPLEPRAVKLAAWENLEAARKALTDVKEARRRRAYNLQFGPFRK